jgi:hypothetical protein
MEQRRRRIAELRRQQAEFERQIEWLASEIEGLTKGYYLVASDAIERMERRHPEAWSPVPLLGYRVWDLRPRGLYGVRVKWKTPELTATCSLSYPDEIPHTAGRCGCGIYAAKHVHELLVGFAVGKSRGFAVGLVEMAGKVVEHERGYRAAQARVVALAVSGSTKTVLTDDPELIAAIFADPWVVHGFPDRQPSSWQEIHDEIEQYLMDQAWRRSQWTLASRNE